MAQLTETRIRPGRMPDPELARRWAIARERYAMFIDLTSGNDPYTTEAAIMVLDHLYPFEDDHAVR